MPPIGANPMDPAAQSALARLSPEFSMKLGESKWKMEQERVERETLAALMGGGNERQGSTPAIAGQPQFVRGTALGSPGAPPIGEEPTDTAAIGAAGSRRSPRSPRPIRTGPRGRRWSKAGYVE